MHNFTGRVQVEVPPRRLALAARIGCVLRGYRNDDMEINSLVRSLCERQRPSFVPLWGTTVACVVMLSLTFDA